MPPTFAYILALVLYLAVACGVWSVTIVMAISENLRPLAKKIAAGMAGSFPGVFIFQILVAPLVGLILLIVFGVSHFFKPPDIMIVFLVLFIISLPVIASLLGFYAGWRVAWELAAGRSHREFLNADRVLGPVIRFLRRRLPVLQRFL